MSADLIACSCGREVEPQGSGRCPACGRWLPGNSAAVVVGERSRQFWKANEEERRQLEDRIIRDAGYTRDTAPVGLLLAARTAAQAASLQEAAYDRVNQSGGPLTSSDRPRRAYRVWCNSSDRLDRAQRLIEGMERPADRRPMAALEAVPEVAL